ncbi:17441_t:CDS:2 [Funneliformis geosporum]|uniref:Branched-chain-amino-acid aminotransferase n=1 Tax=Funneliformis geosporum TaxID=1117311 RepID=A0A9W4SI70_9GLOM|nr:17441_t:CDS:2 [Funneliformis geosporum]CAI2169975.1 4029_t:CDS:2 [Funneliformis geosporum]
MFAINFLRFVKKKKQRSNKNKIQSTSKSKADQPPFSTTLDSSPLELDFKKQTPINLFAGIKREKNPFIKTKSMNLSLKNNSNDDDDLKNFVKTRDHSETSAIKTIEPYPMNETNNQGKIDFSSFNFDVKTYEKQSDTPIPLPKTDNPNPITEKSNESSNPHLEINHEWYSRFDTAWYFSTTNDNEPDKVSKNKNNEAESAANPKSNEKNNSNLRKQPNKSNRSKRLKISQKNMSFFGRCLISNRKSECERLVVRDESDYEHDNYEFQSKPIRKKDREKEPTPDEKRNEKDTSIIIRKGTPIAIRPNISYESHHLNPNKFWTWKGSNSSSENLIETINYATFDDLYISQKGYEESIRTKFIQSSTRLLLPRAATTFPASFQQTLYHSTLIGKAKQHADIDHNKIRLQRSENLKPLLPNKDLVFGRSFTDHMLTIEWKGGQGWLDPIIQPYGKISLEPSAMVFHYAFECFEGLKAYKDRNGKIRLFRPDMNMKRFKKSAARITLPDFNGDELLECLKKLVRLDERWIPAERGFSLYIRPTLIGIQTTLGVGACEHALLFIICSPVGPYYKTGFSAVKLLATTENVRAWHGGTGNVKIGGNYAPCVKPQLEAAEKGYQQNLWLFGTDDEITEVGTMNCFVHLINEQGEKELVTPPLDGTILAGVTRDSILSLARSWNEFKVSERKITMLEVIKAQEEGRLLEMFGAGTACIVSPIKGIHYRGRDLNVPLDPNDLSRAAGPITKRFADILMGIQYGEIPHEWSVVVT